MKVGSLIENVSLFCRTVIIDNDVYRPSLRLYHPALLLRNPRIKTSKRDQALSATSQCERRSYQRRHNARGDVMKLAFVKRKTVLGRKKRPVIER